MRILCMPLCYARVVPDAFVELRAFSLFPSQFLLISSSYRVESLRGNTYRPPSEVSDGIGLHRNWIGGARDRVTEERDQTEREGRREGAGAGFPGCQAPEDCRKLNRIRFSMIRFLANSINVRRISVCNKRRPRG